MHICFGNSGFVGNVGRDDVVADGFDCLRLFCRALEKSVMEDLEYSERLGNCCCMWLLGSVRTVVRRIF